MSAEIEKKLLVVVDGSRRSIDTVRYLARMPSFCRMQIHLFNVFTAIPETYWDLEREPAAISNVSQLHAWESQHRSTIEEHMRQCKEILLAQDVHPKNIHTRIYNRKKGVARDIMTEARKGYAAVVLRRRGMTRLQKMVMGSTALKLLNGLEDIPLVFAGNRPGNPRILIAFDGSENAFRAVDFACAMLVPGHHSVTLVSVLRTYSADETQETRNSAVKDVIQLPLDPPNHRLSQATARIRACGFEEDMVQTKILSYSSSRAGTIIDLAIQEDFGTIIVGRRGHSSVGKFSFGRVSNKILQLSAPCSVCVVN